MNILPVMKSITMSSREIAELTGKRHDNVLADIRIMLKELYPDEGILKFQDTQIDPQNGQSYPIFRLPKRETLILVSGYSITMRAKIIDRWQELEDQAAAKANKVAAATTWEQQRQTGKEIRADFTNTLENHGVSGFGFAQCTNGIYRPAFAEIVATERMDANQDQGNSPCYKTCKASGEAVSDLLVKKLN